MAIKKNKKRIDPRYFLSETTYRDEEIVKEISGAAIGDGQQGPNTPEGALTARWIKNVESYLKEAENWEKQTARHYFTQYIVKLKDYLDQPRVGIRQDLPVRPHGQNIPVDATKYVEAPTPQEMQEINKAHNLGHDVFLALTWDSPQAPKLPPDPAKAIHNEWPRVRYLTQVPGAKFAGTQNPDDERAYSRYVHENLQKIITEEVEVVLTEKEKWEQEASKSIEKKGHEGIFKKWCKDNDHGGVNQTCINAAYKAGKPWKKGLR